MEKKILKAMYSSIVSKDPIRPIMTGVFFDQNCCVATDTHMLVVFKHTNPKFAGKVMSASGEEISGTFPDYNRVFPAKEKLSKFHPRIDLAQLQKACAWFSRQPGFTEKDSVVIRGKGLSIKFLGNILSLIALTPEIKSAEMLQTPEGNAAVIKSKSFRALLMPLTVDESKVDAPREEECPVTLTLENLINMFVFEGWKPKPQEDPMAWMD